MQWKQSNWLFSNKKFSLLEALLTQRFFYAFLFFENSLGETPVCFLKAE